LIAGTVTATDRADQLATFDQRKSTGTRDQGRIKRRDIAMAGLKRVVSSRLKFVVVG
jgi:hypothetical protein